MESSAHKGKKHATPTINVCQSTWIVALDKLYWISSKVAALIATASLGAYYCFIKLPVLIGFTVIALLNTDCSSMWNEWKILTTWEIWIGSIKISIHVCDVTIIASKMKLILPTSTLQTTALKKFLPFPIDLLILMPQRTNWNWLLEFVCNTDTKIIHLQSLSVHICFENYKPYKESSIPFPTCLSFSMMATLKLS